MIRYEHPLNERVRTLMRLEDLFARAGYFASQDAAQDHHGALPKALELAERVAANAPLTNFAVLQALPMIAEANPQTGLLMESLMATVTQSDQEAKRRIRAFLDRKTAKVKPT